MGYCLLVSMSVLTSGMNYLGRARRSVLMDYLPEYGIVIEGCNLWRGGVSGRNVKNSMNVAQVSPRSSLM